MSKKDDSAEMSGLEMLHVSNEWDKKTTSHFLHGSADDNHWFGFVHAKKQRQQ